MKLISASEEAVELLKVNKSFAEGLVIPIPTLQRTYNVPLLFIVAMFELPLLRNIIGVAPCP